MTSRIAALLLVASVLVAGCSGSDEPGRSARPTSYVALGDSFVSGPGILPHVPSSGTCLRSERDYPALLAATLDVDVVDVSCGGATTDHVLRDNTTGAAPIPAQIDAVTTDTDLVTIGIGGNDGRYYEGYFNSCLFPAYRSSDGCRTFAEEQGPQILVTTRAAITRTIEAVQRRAPAARVVVVGYLRILPSSGACPSMSIAPADVAQADRAQRALEQAQQDAAREAGAAFVSVRRASEGHDACAAADPWVNGLENSVDDGIYLHPTSAGMRAVAAEVAAAVSAG